MASSKKAINFDLNINALKEHYPKHYTNAYYDIESFMDKNGFKHRQGSGYESKEKINKKDISKLIKKLIAEYPWLNECVSKFDVTNIGKQYDLTAEIQKATLENILKNSDTLEHKSNLSNINNKLQNLKSLGDDFNNIFEQDNKKEDNNKDNKDNKNKRRNKKD